MRGDLSVSLSIYLAIYEKTVRAPAGPWVAYETKGKIKLGTRGECRQSETMARRSVLLRLPLLLLNAASAANNASLVNSLRRHLLTDLDPKVAPSTPDGGLVTKVQFRIFKVISVDVSSGALVLKVWRRVRWFDERLALGWHGTPQNLKAFEPYSCTRAPEDIPASMTIYGCRTLLCTTLSRRTTRCLKVGPPGCASTGACIGASLEPSRSRAASQG